jgi:hypothetical protein
VHKTGCFQRKAQPAVAGRQASPTGGSALLSSGTSSANKVWIATKGVLEAARGPDGRRPPRLGTLAGRRPYVVVAVERSWGIPRRPKLAPPWYHGRCGPAGTSPIAIHTSCGQRRDLVGGVGSAILAACAGGTARSFRQTVRARSSGAGIRSGDRPTDPGDVL